MDDSQWIDSILIAFDNQHLLPTFKYVEKRGEVIGNVYDNKELLK